MKLERILVFTGLLLGVGCVPSPGCQSPLSPHPHPGHHARFEVRVNDPLMGEVMRSYLLHLPANYDTSNTPPVPLMLDYHGWTGDANDQMVHMPWKDVANTDNTPFIVVTTEGMDDIAHGSHGWGSWNVSNSEGPLGLTCDPSLHFDYPCYSSCDFSGDCSYNENACTFSSCHDDIVYTQSVLYDILDTWCVDTDQIHMSGASNGGMFIYSKALESLADSLASVGPVCGAPLLGFNPMPDTPVNIIDFHGLEDDTIPWSPEVAGNLGAGPHDTVEASDGWYYHIKMVHLTKIITHMNCEQEAREYPTHMDGVDGWVCQLWTGCDEGKEVVQCNANYGHDYPFSSSYIDGVQILWNFMKSHPK